MNAVNDETLNAKEAEVIETEVIKGEHDDVLEEYPQTETKETQRTFRSKLPVKTLKITSVQYDTPKKQDEKRFASARIEELAKPTRHRVLTTLREKASTLPPAFVDNLIRAIEVETCLTPEQATQVLQRRKCKKRKATRLSSLTKKLRKETTKLDVGHAMTLDRDATMCQYLMAERFVKSILSLPCRTQKKDFREISDVIIKRLMSLDGYESARDGSRATEQLHLLADTIACWIVEILVEVADTRREWLQEYCKKKLMKRIEAEDDDETDSETEIWRQMVLQREHEKRKMKKEEVYQKGDEVIEGENGEYKREDEDDMKVPAEEQLMEMEERINEKETKEKEYEEEYKKTEDQEDKKEEGDVDKENQAENQQ